MKTHIETRSLRKASGSLLAGLFVLCFFAFVISGQAPPAPTAPETIPAGSLVIPMDNVNQGNAGGTTFNLRAYGLVNHLLQNNVPVKWAIKPGKAKNAEDFSANVTRIAGGAGVGGPTSVSFSGGPFIVMAEFDTPTVRNLINSFNGAPGVIPVTVYETNENKSVDIRYNVTHKPKIAVGPDGGNLGTSVHQQLFNAAGIPNFAIVDNSIVNANSCFTLATQAHSEQPQFVNLYRQFAQSGGNLLLQCKSVDTYENNANGHFQALVAGQPNLAGYNVFGTNTPSNAVDTTLVYPTGSMPFNQFIGALANQTGAVTEYSFAPGATGQNGHLVSVRNGDPHAEKFIATVSQLNGPNAIGGTVFELGGHNYFLNTSTTTEIERLNGQRMILNTIFVPVTRPCGVQGATVIGFKSVRRFNVRMGGFPLIAGDTLEWTVDYINNSPVEVNNFQIRDVIQPNLTLIAGPTATVVTAFGGASASRNASYDGIGNDSTSDLLAGGAILPPNGRIQVKVRMTINIGTPGDTILRNQTGATGSSIATVTNSDNIDQTNTSIFGPGDQPPPDSILQPQDPNSIDPTIARIKAAPTAAAGFIEGAVRDAGGMGIGKATVKVINATTGAATSVRTNSLGSYRVEGLEIGQLYIVTVDHKQYHFPEPTVTFTLSDNVSGLSFVGNLIQTRAPVPAAKGKR